MSQAVNTGSKKKKKITSEKKQVEDNKFVGSQLKKFTVK